MRIKKNIKVLIIIVCGVLYLYSAINTNKGDDFSVIVDTAKPLSIVWPAEVAIVGDNGEKGFRIGANIGRGWLEEAGGEASYKFYVPRDDKYYIWANCLWFDECANAVFAKFDDLEKAIFGNDPIYNQWHWVRGFEVYLGKGTHELVLSNHSDHISLQKIFLSNSVSITPEDCNNVFSDIFYDGFDGCDQGNYQSWKQIRGSWLVQEPTQQMCFIENALIGKSEDSSFIIYEGNHWSDYILNIAVKPVVSENTQGTFSICFGVEDPNEYHELICQLAEESDVCKMQIRRSKYEIAETLADFKVPWNITQWHQVEINLNPDNIEVQIDNNNPVVTNIDYKIIGGIGFHLEGEIITYFDDIHVIMLIDNKKN